MSDAPCLGDGDTSFVNDCMHEQISIYVDLRLRIHSS